MRIDISSPAATATEREQSVVDVRVSLRKFKQPPQEIRSLGCRQPVSTDCLQTCECIRQNLPVCGGFQVQKPRKADPSDSKSSAF